MFKKYAWIVALLAALTMVTFVGCGGGGDDDGDGDDDPTWEGGEFDLQDFLGEEMFADLEDGDDVFSILFPNADDNSKRKDSPIYPAGGNNTQVKFTLAEYAIKVETVANWGAGIDFNHAYFGFQAGDKITVSGYTDDAFWYFGIGTPYFPKALGGWNSTADMGEFEFEYTLTAADVADIIAADPQGIRLGNKGHAMPGSGSDAGNGKVLYFMGFTIERDAEAADSYTVTFMDGDDEVDAITVDAGGTVAVTEVPALEDTEEAEFDGWFNEEGVEFDRTSPVFGNLVFFAKWTTLWKVTLHAGDDGEFEADEDTQVIKVRDGGKIAQPAGPTWTGTGTMYFQYWAAEEDGDDEFDFAGTEITEDIDLYAVFDADMPGRKVFFYDGTTALTELTIEGIENGTTLASNSKTLPTADDVDEEKAKYYSLAWEYGDEAFTTSTVITDGNYNVYTKWTFVGGTPYTEGGEMIVDYPLFTVTPGDTHSEWSGEENEDGSFVISTGGIRYQFPDGIGDYDFITVKGTAESVNSTVLKQYDSGVDYPSKSGSLSASTELVWELRKATSNGVAIQKYAAGTSDMDIQITQVVFTKGTRYKITFDTDGGTPATIAEDYGVDGCTIGDAIPPRPSKENFVFLGWKDQEDNTVTATTVITKDLTLTAQWAPFNADAVAMTLKFSDSDIEVTQFAYGSDKSENRTYLPDGSGYLCEAKDSGYGNISYFQIELPAGVVLSDYESIEFKIKLEGPDAGWKSVGLLAVDDLADLTDNYPGDPSGGTFPGSFFNHDTSAGTERTYKAIPPTTVTSDKPYIAIWGHLPGPDTGTGEHNSFTVSDVKLVPFEQ